MSYIKINNAEVPPPVRGISIKRTPEIGVQYTADGRIVAQRINNRIKIEFDALQWNYLTAEQWQNILDAVLTDSYGTITVYDEFTGSDITIDVLFTGTQEEPFKINEYGRPTSYVNCKVLLKDMGYEAIEDVENV